jgi:acyl-[acyl-carrier-protein]-phospholipid O-acyltransferase/long-chain-fatty-acid--[acyl-carrier-protein] ligase
MKGIQVLHSERFPAHGAVIVPTRLNEAEAAELEHTLHGRRVVRFGAAELAGGVPDAVRQAVAGNGFALFLPAPVETWPGSVSDLPRAVLQALVEWQLPVVPLAVDRPATDGLPSDERALLAASVLVPGPAIPPGSLTVIALFDGLLRVGEEAFSGRPTFDGHLGRALLRGIKRNGARVSVVDGMDGSELTYDKVLAAALALSQFIKKETTCPRLGIVLPPGKAGLIANLAVVLAGKVPVNLNFTAGKPAIESAMRQSGIDRILTVDLVVRKMQEFPWFPMRQLILIERVMPELKSSAVKWGLLAKLLPPSVLATLLGLPRDGGDAEAALLFTSGSSGEPKGVILSHRNLLANVTQFGLRINLGPGDKVLGSLPLFHSFGCTVTLWWVLLEGLGLVTYPSPLDVPKLAGLIEKYRISLLLTTPTFLRGYLRKAKREQLASLRLIVTGAEKLPPSLALAFHDAFGKEVMEGYGLTETSPASNVNLPALPSPPDGREVMPSHRPGSVGQLLPGMALRITDALTGHPLPLDQQGIIWFKGANVFPGYLNQPRRTEEVLQDGWLRTGDLGRLDEDGFLYIEGRLSRFSKIGGEMVPHEAVEEHINRALGLEGEDERKIAVVGVPDPDKGEALVLLSTVAGETIKQEIIQLRYALLDRGVPALWIPKKLLRVSEIPMLASGKMDLRKCEEIARSAED